MSRAVGVLAVWQIDLTTPPAVADRLLPLLDRAEQARVERLAPALRHRYIIAHGALRQILSDYTGEPPQQLTFVHNRWGKPTLCGAAMPHFNLTHSGDIAMCAVADSASVAALGIDIERQRPAQRVNRLRLARRFFSAAEADQLAALPVEQQESAFFRCWTGKEAYPKAKGWGLSHPLNRFTLNCDPAQPLQLIAAAESADLNHFRLWSLPIEEPYHATLAAHSVSAQIEPIQLRWVPD